MRLCAAPRIRPPEMKNTGSSGANADGSTPSSMIMLRSRSSASGSSICPATLAPTVSPSNFGGSPTPMALTRSRPPSAKAIMSPFAENRVPSRSEHSSPCSRERKRISVEPSVPAASTTEGASTWRASPFFVSDRLKCTRQPPSRFSIWLMVSSVKISAPCACASER